MIQIDVRPEVQNALDNSKPVVALESTIITHGMPWPENKQFNKKSMSGQKEKISSK